jgi:uncharacterized protein YjbI with pentapeptide repeats
MANKEHIEILSQGVDTWNKWKNDTNVRPDLSGENLEGRKLPSIDLSNANLVDIDFTKCDLSRANFSSSNLCGAYFLNANLYKANFNNADLNNSKINYAYLPDSKFIGASLIGADLSNADLEKANFTGANLRNADLISTNLTETDFTNADLSGANLCLALCVETNLINANINGARVYGVSAWNLRSHGLKQNNLIVTRHKEQIITLDNIEQVQYINLLLDNPKISDLISATSSKVVLILGRFETERKKVLEAIRYELRNRDFVPIIFDFDGANSRDTTETIKILVGMSRFVIADITNPKSSPLELQATIPDYKIPFVTIIQDGEDPFSMFVNLQQKYNWVLPTLKYRDIESLRKGFKRGIIDRALEVGNRLLKEKLASTLPIEDIKIYESEDSINNAR